MNAYSKAFVARWLLLTMLGLTAGIAAAFVLDRPIEAIVGVMLITHLV